MSFRPEGACKTPPLSHTLDWGEAQNNIARKAGFAEHGLG